MKTGRALLIFHVLRVSGLNGMPKVFFFSVISYPETISSRMTYIRHVFSVPNTNGIQFKIQNGRVREGGI